MGARVVSVAPLVIPSESRNPGNHVWLKLVDLLRTVALTLTLSHPWERELFPSFRKRHLFPANKKSHPANHGVAFVCVVSQETNGVVLLRSPSRHPEALPAWPELPGGSR